MHAPRITVASGLLLLNGTYDVICALAIVFDCCAPFSRLHIDMFVQPEVFQDVALRNLLAHWIFLYGLIRLCCGAELCCLELAASTYLLEMHCLMSMGHKLIPWKANMVSATCAALVLLCVWARKEAHPAPAG